MLKAMGELDKLNMPVFFGLPERAAIIDFRKWLECVQSESADSEAAVSNFHKFMKLMIETTDSSQKMLKELKKNVGWIDGRRPKSTRRRQNHSRAS